jgi:hypothetical protein
MSKTLVLYVFHIYNERVTHFINNCIFYDENVDFMMISNNKNNVFEVPDYVKKMFRDNIGYDFGGWSDALMINDLYKQYEHFIFVNSSVIGPYLSNHHKGKWTDIYINGLQNNIKLFGSTINAEHLDSSHVQSYIFSMDKNALEYLIQCKIFTMDSYTNSLAQTIHIKEILMSRKIIENGWNIGSLMNCYKNIDFTFKDKRPEEYNVRFYGDLMYSRYRNVHWNEYEVVFIKGNRIKI